MRRVCNREKVADEIGAIGYLSRMELVEQWTTIYRRPPPKGLSRRLMEDAAAYQVQARAFGGLRPSVRRKLSKRLGGGTEHAVAQENAKALTPGSRLMREWHGRTYWVDALDDGFRCDGKHYRSLSQIACALTGARWSGPRFFGL